MLCGMVILNYQDSKRAKCLAQRCAEFDVIQKIIVVDNCSNDGSYEELSRIENEKISVIQSGENGGFAKGNNCGAKYLINYFSPEYILFANTDTIFPEENILVCIETLKKNPSMGLVSTRMKGPDGKEQLSYFSVPTFGEYLQDYIYIARRKRYFKRMYIPENHDAVISVDAVRGSFMLFRTEAFEKANCFDEQTFMYCEESIMSMRLQKAGYGVGVCADKWYIHDHHEAEENAPISAYKRLYKSRQYMMVNYKNINRFQQMLMSVLAAYSIMEFRVIAFIKRKGKKK